MYICIYISVQLRREIQINQNQYRNIWTDGLSAVYGNASSLSVVVACACPVTDSNV